MPELPKGWQVADASGPPGFVTRMTLVSGDGAEYVWTSRRHRKRLGMVATSDGGGAVPRPGHADPTSWWLAALFGAGATCFALGSLPLFFTDVAPAVLTSTFFVGSLLFTTAAYLQFHQSIDAPDDVLAFSPGNGGSSILQRHPHRIDWWAGIVQLAGTIAFNLTTVAAFWTDLSVDQEKRLIWAPDVVGSICFLVAGSLAWAEVNHGIRPRPDGSVGWRIAALNMTGSIAFGAAAVAARYVPTTGDPANIALVNLGTFVGALCFLVGAILLPVESARDARPAPAGSQ